MNWKLFPRNVGFVCDGKKVDFYICEKGIVLEEQYVTGDEPVMDKAIKPLILRNRSYIRIRRAGIDKKFQLAMIFMELFPELVGHDLVIDTRKGPWSITDELKRLKSCKVKDDAVDDDDDCDDAPPPLREDYASDMDEDMASSEEEPANLSREGNPEPDGGRKVCRICDVRKTLADFNHKPDICDDCYFDRKELMKEIVMKRRMNYDSSSLESSRRRA